MPAEREEVTVESLHVDRQMGCTLCCIDQHGHVVTVGNANDMGNGINGAQHIAYVGNTDQAGSLVDELWQQVGT